LGIQLLLQLSELPRSKLRGIKQHQFGQFDFSKRLWHDDFNTEASFEEYDPRD